MVYLVSWYRSTAGHDRSITVWRYCGIAVLQYGGSVVMRYFSIEYQVSNEAYFLAVNWSGSKGKKCDPDPQIP
jgi:hypothetical protein